MRPPLSIRLASVSLLVAACVRPAPLVAQQAVTDIVSRAGEAIRPLSDSLALHKAGYFSIGFGGGVKDLTPFQGQHWLQVARFAMNPAIDLTVPTFMMYLPLGDSLV